MSSKPAKSPHSVTRLIGLASSRVHQDKAKGEAIQWRALPAATRRPFVSTRLMGDQQSSFTAHPEED